MDEQAPPRVNRPVSFYLLLLLATVVLAVWLWLNLHGQVAYAVLVWKHTELQALHSFTFYYDGVDRQAVSIRPDQITLAQLGRLFNIVGSSISTPACVLLLTLAVAAYFFAPSRRFRTPLDADGVFRAQGEPFRCAGAYVGREQPLVEPKPEAPQSNDFALHAPEWITRHAWDAKAGFQPVLCRLALARQLGPVWTGPAAAQPHARFLFAAFALHAVRERAEATRLLGDFAQFLARGGDQGALDVLAEMVARADAILADRDVTAGCVEVAARHAFQSTALMAVLEHARDKAGVLAPAQFNGLKLVDRDLWYALHSMGMPNPYIEALGARDHLAAERMAGRPLPSPSIDRAMLTVRTGLGEVRGA
jgi:intracellular multiplication protein IcmP